MTPILETDRLILRPVTFDDAPAVQKYFNNWNIVQYLSMKVPWPYPDDGAVSFLRDIALPKVEKGESMVWAVTLKASENPDETVGIIDYHVLADGYGNRGFWLAGHLWGQGLMTEAVAAFQDYIFFDLGVPDITVCNAVSNGGSRRVKEKTGAEYIGAIKLEHHSGHDDAQQWRVTREAWARIRNVSLDSLPECRPGGRPRKERGNPRPRSA